MSDSDGGLDDLMSALAEVGSSQVSVVSDTHAANGLVRLIVHSDATVSVEIDPYAAEDSPVADIERYLTDLFRAAPIPDPTSGSKPTDH
ncbi:hypothetical protein [Glycomyces buryatensis]|uniref:Uncharacterized protein n=1 Tax=Glycomyces buryatensis TaxID=2570927 RepID=A0A4S8QGV3_9ACTN|nr:hypothetical protein [Glycomyces buryatensis]THV42412.1 hypothetical protein FAB82_07095 [Glycomyces buryatensis]